MDMTAQEKFTGVLRYIRHHQDGEVVAKMSDSGIRYNMNYGLALYLLMKKAEETGRDTELAKLLWNEDIRETRLLYFMIEQPEVLNEAKLDYIVQTLRNRELVEVACLYLFVHTDYAIKKAVEWTGSDNEYVRMAAFMLTGRIALKRKDISVEQLRPLVDIFSQIPENGNLFDKRSITFAMTALAKAGLKEDIAVIAQQLQAVHTPIATFVSQNVVEELKYM